MTSHQAAQQNPQPTTAPASSTITVTSTPSSARTEHVRLRLRGQNDQEPRPERRLRWAEDVVNNEGMGKKSSKVCCIYHKPREVGESSSEDSDASSSDDDSSGNDDGAARPSQRRGQPDKDRKCGHEHGQKKVSVKKERKSSPNAYEKQPTARNEKPKPAS